MNKELLNAPGCERIKDFYNVGPIQRANVECFFDAIVEHLAAGECVEPVGYWCEGYYDDLEVAQNYCDTKAQLAEVVTPLVTLDQLQTAIAAARVQENETLTAEREVHASAMDQMKVGIMRKDALLREALAYAEKFRTKVRTGMAKSVETYDDMTRLASNIKTELGEQT